MRERVYRLNGRMLIETGHKAFDRQTSAILPGQQIGDTVSSWSIRGELNDGEGLVDYPANIRKPGQLRECDLLPWNNVMPAHVRKAILAATDNTNRGVLVYHFFHFNGEHRVSHGWLIARGRRTVAKYPGRGRHDRRIVDECESYVTEEAS